MCSSIDLQLTGDLSDGSVFIAHPAVFYEVWLTHHFFSPKLDQQIYLLFIFSCYHSVPDSMQAIRLYTSRRAAWTCAC